MSLWDTLRSLFGGPAGRPVASSPPPEPPVTDFAQLRALIQRHGMEALEAEIVGAARPCFHMFADGVARDAPTGATRLGGLPDLERGVAWPLADDGSRAVFLGQFDLADLAQRAPGDLFPVEGLMSFFVTDFQGEAGHVGVRMIYSPPGATLAPNPAPSPSEAERMALGGVLNPVFVRFEPGLNIPYDNTTFLMGLDPRIDDDAADALDQTGWAPPGSVGRLGGYGVNDNNDDFPLWLHLEETGHLDSYEVRVWESWEAWTHAKASHRSSRSNPWRDELDGAMRWWLENGAAANAAAADWRCVLRFDSNTATNFAIDDIEPMWIYARERDLAAGDWSKLRGRITQI